MKRDELVRALGTDDDAFMAALAELADGMIEEFRGAAGEPLVEPHVAKGYACMSSGVDAFVAELENCRALGRRMRAGASLEVAEGENEG